MQGLRERRNEQCPVLLVEDNPDDAFAIREALEHSNTSPATTSFRVTHCESLSDAAKVLAEGEFEVMLCDLGLPDSRGLETVVAARQLATKLPLVVMTSVDDDELAIEAIRAGAQDYLVKDYIDLDRLCRLVRKAVERHRILGTLQSNFEIACFKATHDDLTGLANRYLFERHLERAMALSARRSQLVAVMFLDLDRFKPINDEHGHEVGDELLQRFAERLRQGIRESDVACRFGGDEFLVLLDHLDSREAAVETASKILARVTGPYIVNGTGIRVEASFGLACYPGDASHPRELIRVADDAMYVAKRSRSDRARVAQ